MADVRIEVGTTTHGDREGFRHIGIQPPLTQEQTELLRKAHTDNPDIPVHFEATDPGEGELFSETSIGNVNSPIAADMDVKRKAQMIGLVLQQAGDTVTVDLSIRSMGHGHFLFESVVKEAIS